MNYQALSDEKLLQLVQGQSGAADGEDIDYASLSDEELLKLVNPPQKKSGEELNIPESIKEGLRVASRTKAGLESGGRGLMQFAEEVPEKLAKAASELFGLPGKIKRPSGFSFDVDERGKIGGPQFSEETLATGLTDFISDILSQAQDSAKSARESGFPLLFGPAGPLVQGVKEMLPSYEDLVEGDTIAGLFDEPKTGVGRTALAAISGVPFGPYAAGFTAGAAAADELGYGELGELVLGLAGGGVGSAIEPKLPSPKKGPPRFETGVPEVARGAGTAAAEIESKFAQKKQQKALSRLAQEEGAKITKAVENSAGVFKDVIKDVAPEEIPDFVEKAKDNVLSDVFAEDQSAKQVGETVKEKATERFNSLRGVERALYDTVKSQMEAIKGSFEKDTVREMRSLIEELDRKGAPKEQKEMVDSLRKTIEDMTEENPQLKKVKNEIETLEKRVESLKGFRPGEAERVNSRIKNLKSIERKLENQVMRKMPASKMLDIQRDLQNKINYETVIPTYKSRLKEHVKNLRKDVLKAIENTKAKESLETANKFHQDMVDAFGSDAAIKSRKTQTPEDLLNLIKKESNLENIKKQFSSLADSVPKMTEPVKSMERALLSDIYENNKPYRKKDLLRAMTPESRAAVAALNRLFNERSAAAKRLAKNNAIAEGLAEAARTGKIPTDLAKFFETRELYRDLKQTLEQVPNGKKLLESMNREYAGSVLAKFIDPQTKVIDWKRLPQELSKSNRAIFEEMGILKDLERIEKYSENISKNAEAWPADEIAKARRYYKGRDSFMVPFVLYTLGVPPPLIALIKGVSALKTLTVNTGGKVLYQLTKNPKARNAIERVSKVRKTPFSAIKDGEAVLNKNLKDVIKKD